MTWFFGGLFYLIVEVTNRGAISRYVTRGADPIRPECGIRQRVPSFYWKRGTLFRLLTIVVGGLGKGGGGPFVLDAVRNLVTFGRGLHRLAKMNFKGTLGVVVLVRRGTNLNNVKSGGT